MISRCIGLTLLVILKAANSQSFDTSANSTLHGPYFVREIYIAAQDANGQITSASSAIGIATFDAKGNYTFAGTGTSSDGGPISTLNVKGTYGVSSNGLLAMDSLIIPGDTDYGGVSGLGPSAIVASPTEGGNLGILIGIPVAPAATATLQGGYTAGYIDFLNADIGEVRQATFSATADGAGGLGDLTISGSAVNLGDAPLQQTVAGATYSLAQPVGTGTLSFGSTSADQLISGTKTFYISSDHNIIVGGDPVGFDLLVGIGSLKTPASDATLTGEYYLAGIGDSGTTVQGGPLLNAFYGSTNATGAGTSLFHQRYQSFYQPVFDYTFDSQYSVQTDGSLVPGDIPYQFALGGGGNAFVGTGSGGAYSLMIGLGAPQYSGKGVYLNPLGVVNAANFAPVTNPVAPNEIVVLFVSGLGDTAAQAQTLPLPTSLSGVQVMVNGQAAPLFYVSNGQVAALVPSSIGPSYGIYNATFQVINDGVPSNSVTLFTANSAPGVFSLNAGGTGAAAAQHPDYSLIGSNSPAQGGESVVLYLNGLGAVDNSIPDGFPALSNPVSSVDALTLADLSGDPVTVVFAGLTPGLAGLYQLNATLPSDLGSGSPYVDISTPDAYTSSATLATGAANSAMTRRAEALAQRLRKGAHTAPPTGKSGLGTRWRQW